MIRLFNFFGRLEQIAFYALIFLLPFSFVLTTFAPFSELDAYYAKAIFYFSDLVLVAVFILWLRRIIANHKNNKKEAVFTFLKNFLRLEWFYLLLPAFLVLAALSAVKAQFSGAAFYQIFKLFEFMLFFFYIKGNFSRFNFSLSAGIFIAGALVQSLLIFFQYGREELVAEKLSGLKNFFLTQTNFLRASGSFEHPFLLAAFVGLAALVVYFLVIKEKFFFDLPNPEFLSPVRETLVVRDSFRRMLLSILFFVFILAMVATFSRSLIFSFLFIFLGFNLSLYLDPKTRSVFVRRMAYLLVVFLMSTILISFLTWSEISIRFSPQEVLADPQAIVFDQTAYDFLRENPRFGLGPGNYVLHLAETKSDVESLYPQPINNLYWLLATETGLTGLIVMAVFLGWFLIKAFGLIVSETDPVRRLGMWGLFWALVFVLTGAFFGHFFWTAQSGRLIFWLVLGIIAHFISHRKFEIRT